MPAGDVACYAVIQHVNTSHHLLRTVASDLFTHIHNSHRSDRIRQHELFVHDMRRTSAQAA